MGAAAAIRGRTRTDRVATLRIGAVVGPCTGTRIGGNDRPDGDTRDMQTRIFIRTLDRMAGLSRPTKKAMAFATDLVLLAMSIWIAYSLRIGEWVLWNIGIERLSIGAYAFMVPIFFATGVYQAIFRFAGAGMMRTLIRAFLFYGLAMVLVYMLVGIDEVPRTTAIVQPICFFILIIGARGFTRYLFLDLLGRGRFAGVEKRVLIYGAGTAGQQVASSMSSDPELRMLGFVDDDRRLDGQKLDGDKVYWSGRLVDLIERLEITDVLLAIPGASRKRRRQIVREIGSLKVRVKTLPQTKDIVGGQVSLSDVRPLEIEDLLGREPVAPNELLLGRTIVGKTVLVTGAGGSIGSELCRQIVTIGAKRLALFEMSEFALYNIERELQQIAREAGREIEIVPVMGSVTDETRVAEIFERYPVDTVYHAAAYKHVPLVEANPVEGIRNNVLGTWCMVGAARAAKVDDFILVSTDKAVRPTNVMGASKRGAEQVLQAFAEQSEGTRFSMVRFGNVLGSSGSVVPLFRRQLEAGGPITLTHRDVTRYFMTIPEAATLVIQAGGMAKGGEVFVLDMGEPMRIEKLAQTMVHLSGLTVRDAKNPDGDIEIVEVGLRPGEKLYEELLIGNSPSKTRHARIMMASEDYLAWDRMQPILEQLETCRNREAALAMLQTIVPEFDHGRDNLD